MRQKGFTLTEVLIAMLILSLAAAGMFAVFITGKGFTLRCGRKFEAINFARQTTEHLKDDVRATTWDLSGAPLSLGNHNEPLPSGDLKDKWSGQRNYQVNWGPNDYGHDQRYKVVTVTVSWNEP
jgi:prepilin-type N-terminal cleavage/methylation domain-containing protein